MNPPAVPYAVPYGSLETQNILDFMPEYFFTCHSGLSEDDIKLLKEVFYSFYASLEKLELQLMEPIWRYDTIKNPIVGFFWFSRSKGERAIRNQQNAIGYLMPFSNLGELHLSLTVNNPKFHKAMNTLFPDSTLRPIIKGKGLRQLFANNYRKELYLERFNTAEFPTQRELWQDGIIKANFRTLGWRTGSVMWGLKLKGSDQLLPDYKAFL